MRRVVSDQLSTPSTSVCSAGGGDGGQWGAVITSPWTRYTFSSPPALPWTRELSRESRGYSNGRPNPEARVADGSISVWEATFFPLVVRWGTWIPAVSRGECGG